MILADTSVWIDHLRRGNSVLEKLLHGEQVLVHRFVIGELACGQLKNRTEILHRLSTLPHAPVAGHEEAILLISRQDLGGKGLGWIDIHLLASTIIQVASLWTIDRRLAAAAQDLGVAYIPSA